ncbi:DMT family transporter [Hydrogenophaga sp. 5NK40-0174]|uniref:DMT family transporter n=1 Tax=Hydrogenophaga sp. 5NK40-0174 TaxID=3127649 RepID=UPI00333E816A
MDHPHLTRGILLATLATACFASLDTTSQFVGKAVPVFMAVWLRFTVQTLMTVVLLWPQKRSRLFKTQAPGWQALRGTLMVTSGVVAFISLRHVPVGEFTAVLMLTPLVITLLASFLLREKVSALAWLLVAGGMLGALIVVYPKDGELHLGLLLPLLLVLVNAAYQVVTSKMVRTEDPGTMHFYTGLTGLTLGTVLLPWTWEPLAEPRLWFLVGLLGVFGSLGHYLLIRAYGFAPASKVTPFLYAQIAFATLLGALVFGYIPDAWTWGGIALIVVCAWLGTRTK